MIFKTYDYSNVTVILSSQTWYDKLLHPIFGHPEIKPFRKRLKTAITNPDYVYLSLRDPRSKLFFSKISQGKFSNYYLAVVVKYVKEQHKIIGYVVTA